MYYCTLSHRVGTDEGLLDLYRLDITKDQALARGMKLSPIHMVKIYVCKGLHMPESNKGASHG